MSATLKTLKITKKFLTLTAAVAEAQIDLSYNEAAARQTIAQTDRHVESAFITEDGQVWYIYVCDIRLLHKFEPFSSCLSDAPFRVAYVEGDTLALFDTRVPKRPAGRKWFANNKMGALAY